MISSWNKLITSSISVAFLGITGWATAYCYGWGQALYYGYPWWHVHQGPDQVARSLAYVCVASLALVAGYILGYALLQQVRKSLLFQHIGCLRIFVLISVFFWPVALEFYLFIGNLPQQVLEYYLLFTLIASILLHRVGNRFTLDWKCLVANEQYSVVFTAVFFLYFTLLSFGIGYTRPHFRTTYDRIVFEKQSYYILASNHDVYILGRCMRDNHSFVFFNHNTLKGYKIDVVQNGL
ncbi:hypothetical protein EII21_06025 [Conchiformibius steedae]|uniref:Uncharacterized protein n=1 Tax=Conchiformibius steedae TaxID=153493 RepID=A0A3P2A4B8_9NEIS|nr:hypothetical protein EII21_06025 [Conchiformibius steedae]